MDLIEHTSTWAKGDALQGKIMLFVGILLLFGVIMIFRSNHELLKGALIPLSLATLILAGYGGFLAFTRVGHLDNVKTLYAQDQAAATAQEYEKANTDLKAYSRLKPIWAIALAVLALSFFIPKSTYLQGLVLGLMALFFIALVLDTTLHHRLEPYHKALSESVAK